MLLTNKQNEYIANANHRWNLKVGATGSGKTYLDTLYTIPMRIRERAGKAGLIVIIGNTKGTIQRNIIEPLQEHYSNQLVGNIGADNTCRMFGEKVFCLGADKVNQVTKIQGSTIKYGYGDEMTTWSQEVFEMLKSRLRTPCSIFDGTMNPASPKHFMKAFIDSDADIYCQHYTIDDNPTLPETFVEQLKKEYAGTVYYDWYIRGEWSLPNGIIFLDFANDPRKYIVKAADLPNQFKWCNAAYDLGGNGSAYGLTASAMGIDGVVYILKSRLIQPQNLKSSDVENACRNFILDVEQKYNTRVGTCLIDDNYYTTINDLNDWRCIFGNAAKIKAAMPLFERPMVLSKLMASGRFKLVENECDDLVETLKYMVFDDKSEKAIPLDDGTISIDVYDSTCYSLAPEWYYLNAD